MSDGKKEITLLKHKVSELEEQMGKVVYILESQEKRIETLEGQNI